MAKKSLKNSSIEILIALFFMGSLFFFIPAHAGEHNWVFLGEIEGDLWFIDTDSITCKENTCKTWVKMLSRTSVKKISIENGEYTKSLHEYNCTWREYRILLVPQRIDDVVGAVVGSIDRQLAERGVKVRVELEGDTPPVHGDADQTVPYSHAVRLHQLLDKAGVPNRLLTIPQGGHGDFDARQIRQAYGAIFEFLGQTGLLPAER